MPVLNRKRTMLIRQHLGHNNPLSSDEYTVLNGDEMSTDPNLPEQLKSDLTPSNLTTRPKKNS